MRPGADAPGAGVPPPGLRWLAMVAVVALIVGLRLVVLSSDPYVRLDWSAGLLTDEGFYVHNARNVALFGRARTDEFNNMLLAPALHAAQTAVFGVFGTGSVQARGLSVACSLLMLALTWAAMRRAFGRAAAWLTVAALGLDHVSLLYHRMALMDTPAALGATAAFYAFVRGVGCPGAAHRARAGWLALCGLLIALTVTNRTLCVYLALAPFVGLWMCARGRERRTGLLAVAAGLAAGFVVYAVAWYLPHRGEIAAMAAYYRAEQIQPRSAAHLLSNVYHAALGDFRGVSPYLFRHTPVVFGLALLALAAWAASLKRRQASAGVQGASVDAGARAFLLAWLVGGLVLLAVIGYSPSRYYVSVYPALMGVAALTAVRLPSAWERLSAPTAAARAAAAGLAAFVAYHAVQTFVHRGSAGALVALAAAPALAAVGAWVWPRRRGAVSGSGWAWLVGAAWVAANAWWLAGWLGGLAWTQRDTSRWLADALPAGSVVLGDVAPGICLDNRFVAVNVIPGLCNDGAPVEAYAGRPRYVAILDGRWKEAYWTARYPGLVEPGRRIALRRVLRWWVGVYEVDARDGAPDAGASPANGQRADAKEP